MAATALPLLGPCQVWWGPAGAETELGKTKGVNLRLMEDTAEISYDQTGVRPWDRITTGKGAEVECNFASLDYDLFVQLLPTEATWYGTGGTPVPGPSNDALDITLGLGTSHRAHAQRLILIPYVDGVPSVNTEDWIYGPVAFPVINADLAFNATDQRVVNCTFYLYPESQDLPRVLFMGDESLLPVA